ncbi:hypothetical protein AFLA_012062 [Aspergillus flavus NRRL3357]|nr:hypothetical protein AFLA_012062 [Aspergillus flavus NRRL3357]
MSNYFVQKHKCFYSVLYTEYHFRLTGLRSMVIIRAYITFTSTFIYSFYYMFRSTLTYLVHILARESQNSWTPSLGCVLASA